jgi:hypothetical protein
MRRRPLDLPVKSPHHGAAGTRRALGRRDPLAEEFPPLVREWIAFLAERLAEVAVREHVVDAAP